MNPTLKQRIAASGLKQKFIAQKLGMHPTYLSQIANGRRPMRTRDRAALAVFFSVPEECIFLRP